MRFFVPNVVLQVITVILEEVLQNVECPLDELLSQQMTCLGTQICHNQST